MGYETRMYVVERHPVTQGSTCLVDGKVYSCYLNDRKNPELGYRYYPDGDSRTPVPPEAPIFTGPWCSIIAMLDMSKCGQWPVCDFKDSDGCYIYDTDGDTLVGLDPYGSYRHFVHIDEVLSRLKEERAKDDYRRFRIAIALLTSIKAYFKSNVENIGCLFYGH